MYEKCVIINRDEKPKDRRTVVLQCARARPRVRRIYVSTACKWRKTIFCPARSTACPTSASTSRARSPSPWRWRRPSRSTSVWTWPRAITGTTRSGRTDGWVHFVSLKSYIAKPPYRTKQISNKWHCVVVVVVCIGGTLYLSLFLTFTLKRVRIDFLIIYLGTSRCSWSHFIRLLKMLVCSNLRRKRLNLSTVGTFGSVLLDLPNCLKYFLTSYAKTVSRRFQTVGRICMYAMYSFELVGYHII